MKRIIALLLAALIAAASLPAFAEEEEAASLTVGNPTPMRGEFFTDMWGNATSDIDVRDLLHGCNLAMWDGEGAMFTADPSSVAEFSVIINSKEDHVYTIILREDLCYSDGTPITAWDYAFSWLFCVSPLITELGGTPVRIEQFVGYKDYNEGKTPYLSGVRVLDDYTLEVTLDHAYLPFFYEMGLLLCNPYPIHVIAPGVEVRDDGEGVYLANKDPDIEEPIFTAELLKETVMDPETGYQSHPAAVSGPYQLISWDGVTAEFEINPYFKGDAKGQLPSIQHLTYTLALNDTMIGELAAGNFGLLNKVTRADQITAGMEILDEADIDVSEYLRTGLTYISFACEKETVSSQAVRQAIALCFDRDGATEDYIGDYGLCVDGWYGIGQWMYGVVTGTITPPADPDDARAMAGYAALSLEGLEHYTVDTARAAELLDGDGWVLNDDGLREKDGTVLDLKLIYPEGNNLYEKLWDRLGIHLEEVGIRLTMEALPMAQLLGEWYKQEDREADMFYLGTNFYLVFEPSVHFLTTQDGKHNWSYTNLSDEALYGAAEAMRTTEPGDVLTYLQNWVAFQERFNEILPMIPLYSNLYFDFYTRALQEYYIEEYITWGQAIVQAHME